MRVLTFKNRRLCIRDLEESNIVMEEALSGRCGSREEDQKADLRDQQNRTVDGVSRWEGDAGIQVAYLVPR
jgi:hypothetical protein